MATQAAVHPSRVAAVTKLHAHPHRHILRSASQLFSSLPLGTWVALDLTLLYIGLSIGYELFVVGHFSPNMHASLLQAWGTMGAAMFFSSLVFGLHERETVHSRSRILTRLMVTCATTIILTYAVVYVLMYTSMSRRVVGSAIGMLMVVGGSVRLFACWAMHRVPRTLVIVGPGSVSNSLVRAFRKGFLDQYRLAGYVDDLLEADAPIYGVKRLGSTKDLAKVCDRHGIQEIVVGAEAATDQKVMQSVLPCLRHGCRVTNEATFYEKATGQILVDEITPHWFLYADLQVHCQRRQALKRAFDIVTSIVGIIMTIPLVPIIAVLTKLDDGGPVFYSQTRVGQRGKPFTLHKFRTMRVGAESKVAVWATKDDPRVTRIGRLLRRTRLDELPQFYNILLGQMSVVGPRPERPTLVDTLTEEIAYYNERHLVKPGLTGWAQIGFRYGASIEDAKRKLQFDLYYVKNMGIELDLMILLRTMGVFVRGAC